MSALVMVFVAVVSLAPTFLGCSNKPGKVGTATGVATSQTLRVVRNLGGRAGFRAHWEAWKAAFERDNPGWTMELVDLGNSDGAEYYKARLATGDMPEVIQTWNLTNYLVDNDIIVPLPDSFYERHGIRLPPDYKGKYYTSQGGLQLLGIAVNADLWASAGVSGPPETWQEFMDSLAVIQDAGIQPLAYGGREWSAMMPLSELIQLNLYDYELTSGRPSWTQRRDAGEVTFASDPEMAEVLEWMAYLVDHFVQEGALSDGYNEEQRDFYSGKAATWIMGCWIGGDLEANRVEFNVDYWPVPPLGPRGPRFITNSGGQSGWAISTSAAHGEKYEKALRVLDAFYDPDVYQLYLNGEAMLDDRIDSPVQGPRSDWPQAQHFYDSMAANYARYGGAAGAWRSCTDKWPTGFENSLMRVAQELIMGQTSHESLLATLDADWENARKGE